MNLFGIACERQQGQPRPPPDLDDARSKMEDWRKDYNEVRPHGAIGNNPPITLQNQNFDGPAPPCKKPENSNFRRSKEWEQRTARGSEPFERRSRPSPRLWRRLPHQPRRLQNILQRRSPRERRPRKNGPSTRVPKNP